MRGEGEERRGADRGADPDPDEDQARLPDREVPRFDEDDGERFEDCHVC